MGRQLDQAFGLKSPDPFPSQRVGSGDKTNVVSMLNVSMILFD